MDPIRPVDMRLLVIAITLNVIAIAFSGALMFTSGYMISLAATLPLTVLALHIPSLFVRIFGIGKPLIQYAERLISHDWVLRMTSMLRKRVYDALEKSTASLDLGKSLGIFAEDIDHVQNLFLRTVIPQATLVAIYAIAVIAMGLFSPAMGVLLFILMGVICIVLPLISLYLNRSLVRRQRGEDSAAYAIVTESVVDVLDWRLSGRRSDWSERLTSALGRARSTGSSIRSRLRRISIAREVLCAVVIIMTLIWAGVAFAPAITQDAMFPPEGLQVSIVTPIADELASVEMHDSVPYAANWIAAFVLCSIPLLEAFGPLDEAILGHVTDREAERDLASLFDGSPSAPEGSRNDRTSNAHPPSFHEGHDAKGNEYVTTDPDMSDEETIAVSGLSFTYPGSNTEVLKGLDLDVMRGEKVAIIGRSGTGKTTLMNLVSHALVPTAGSICSRGRIGIIDQDPYVFNMPIRENLLLAHPDASDEEIRSVLGKVGLSYLVERSQDGLDTLIAEDGIDVSGGERHRLALARILLHGCDIVILDEPFQGLDERTAKDVSQSVFDSLDGRTLLVVTHDLDVLDGFDRVLELSEGRLVEVDLASLELRV